MSGKFNLSSSSSLPLYFTPHGHHHHHHHPPLACVVSQVCGLYYLSDCRLIKTPPLTHSPSLSAPPTHSLFVRGGFLCRRCRFPRKCGNDPLQSAIRLPVYLLTSRTPTGWEDVAYEEGEARHVNYSDNHDESIRMCLD